MAKVYTFSQVQEILGFKRLTTVGEVVTALGIEPKPHPHNGLAKALTDRDVKFLRRRLRKLDRTPVEIDV